MKRQNFSVLNVLFWYDTTKVVRVAERTGSNEGLRLEKSAFQIFHGDNSSFINSFDKTKFSFIRVNLKL